MRIALLVLWLAATAGAAAPAAAQTLQNAFPNLSFDDPVDLQAPDDGSNRLFVVERDGRIHVFENDEAATSATLFLDIDPLVTSGSETGLLGLAFAPDYPASGHFYVYYTAPSPLRSVVSRFSVSAADPDQADPNSEEILMTVDQPFSNHNAGQLQFGPPEGPGGERYLYVGLGDGGSSGDPQDNGQTTSTLLGSMLRLDVDGGGLPLDCASGTGTATVPADNPFVGQAGFCDEIWAYGFRNPWRMRFDEAGDWALWAGDVGQNQWEEVDVVESGGNYGWNTYEANSCYDPPCDPAGLTFPVYAYSHSGGRKGGFAVIGGYVYDGPNCDALRGLYVYGDNVTGNVWTLDYDGATATNALLLGLTGRSISSFGLDEQGDLFLVDLSNGRLYRFSCPMDVAVTAAPLAPPVVVGPGGGTAPFDLTLTNTTAQSQTVDLWIAADLADGSEREPVLGPRPLTLPAGATLSRTVQLRVPAAVPAGTSTFVVKVGAFPDGPISSDRFTVTKEAAGLSVAGAPAGGASAEGGDVPPSAYPNPFGEVATVRATLAEAGALRVEVLDVLGRRVALLADGPAEAGAHVLRWSAGAAPPGLYLVRVTTGAGTRTLALTRLR